MSGPGGKAVEEVLARLAGASGARLVRSEAGWTLSGPGAGRRRTLGEDAVRRLVAAGLLVRAEPGRLTASAEAAARLRRGGSEGDFAAQHAEIASARIDDGSGVAEVRINRAESPVASLAASRNGRAAWLSAVEADAAERLRRDFEKAGCSRASRRTGRRR